MKASILKKPVLSEKAYKLMEKGIYTFFVTKDAGKKDVKNKIENMFSVNVTKINITPISAKQKRITKTRKTVFVGGGKKAIVFLKAGQTIAALSPKAQSKEKKQKGSKEKDIQKIQVEGKEG